MLFSLAAGLVLVVHLAFIIFAASGAVLASRWRWIPWVHLPAVAWAFLIEISGGLCPLTSLENDLRARAGRSGYSGGFIEHYLLPLIDPGGLTPTIRYGLAGAVVAVNAAAYGWLILRRRQWRCRPVAAGMLAMTKAEFYSGKRIVAVEWWLDDCQLPKAFYWGRLRVFDDGSADATLGQREKLLGFVNRDYAGFILAEDGFCSVAAMDVEDEANHGIVRADLVPPTWPDDADQAFEYLGTY